MLDPGEVHARFGSRAHYQTFLEALFVQLNAGLTQRLQQEIALLGKLPPRRLETVQRIDARVSAYSTIRVRNNTYSVPLALLAKEWKRAWVSKRSKSSTLSVAVGEIFEGDVLWIGSGIPTYKVMPRLGLEARTQGFSVPASKEW